MLFNKSSRLSCVVLGCAFLLTGCASSFFPDFEDTDEVVIDAGGNVEVKEISKKGILVSDKENAAYEDENNESAVFVQKPDAVEVVVPAETVKVEAEKLEPVKEAVDVAENKASTKEKDVDEDDNLITEPAPASNVVTKEEKYVEPREDNALPTMYYLAETVYFDNGSGVVDYKFYSALKNLAKIAKENNAVVSVLGYASSRTRNTDPVSHKLANFKVSAERADNVAKVLRQYGVKSDKIVAQALSDTMPAYQEVMPEGERLNRRVEIYLTY